MNSLNRKLLGGLAALSLVGCSSGPETRLGDYSAHIEASPRSIVVAPITRGSGGTLKVDRYLATITKPLAEKGYYVTPVRMSAELAVQEGFDSDAARETWGNEMISKFGGAITTVGDAMLFLEPEDEQDIQRRAIALADYFNADAVLFVQIDCWDAEYSSENKLGRNIINPIMDYCSDLDYMLTDANGGILWRAHKTINFSKGGGDWTIEIIDSIKKPNDNEIAAAMARDVNRVVIEGKRSKMKGTWYWETVKFHPGPYYPD